MAGIRVFTIALTIVMFAAIGVSMATGDLGDEGSWILDHAWGRMSLIDLYVGIALFAGWVFLRERSWWVAAAWLPVFVVTGNAGTALYAAIASLRSNDVSHFLLGSRR